MPDRKNRVVIVKTMDIYPETVTSRCKFSNAKSLAKGAAARKIAWCLRSVGRGFPGPKKKRKDARVNGV